jgi:hypothetical protein
MSIQTPGETTCNPIETVMTDRQILLHILGHVEEWTELIEVLRPLRPILEAAAPGGKPDAISLGQARRMFKGGRRGDQR